MGSVTVIGLQRRMTRCSASNERIDAGRQVLEFSALAS